MFYKWECKNEVNILHREGILDQMKIASLCKILIPLTTCFTNGQLRWECKREVNILHREASLDQDYPSYVHAPPLFVMYTAQNIKRST